MPRMNKKEIWSIPNLMGYFRILLIPVFAVLYLTAKTRAQFYAAAAVVAVSGVTDMLDGKVARKFHMVTELGKFIDPFADKLTQGALILCLAIRHPVMWVLVGLFIVKEGFMAIMGVLLLRRRGKKLDGAAWFGKVCTAVLYIALALFLLLPGLPAAVFNAIAALCFVVMLGTMLAYIPVFRNMWKPDDGRA